MHLKVIPIAWIGIAASLLPHGRTVASFFHLNIKDGLDQLFRDVTKIDKPFGGKVIIHGGDFRQCLPVVDRKGRDEQISIKRSHLWPFFQVYHLKTNMRAQNADEEWKK
ncbi:hypothetical protein L5515_006849 [Caenorhabditis briggsae]|uniref:ATP-dependent DNA helicase n=1 Tax=Caenorhabditis briggsae TaxID=6238 RepID=A0AAE9EWY1_CAEBR|nr:hypothetical protein L5515_006849 [Caenorhabditis briggsae]